MAQGAQRLWRSLGFSKSSLDVVLGTLLRMALLGQDWSRGTQRSLPVSALLGFWDCEAGIVSWPCERALHEAHRDKL